MKIKGLESKASQREFIDQQNIEADHHSSSSCADHDFIKYLDTWASEEFFPKGPLRDFSYIFPEGAKSGENWIDPLETKKTTFFCWKFQNPGGQRPPFPPFGRPCLDKMGKDQMKKRRLDVSEPLNVKLETFKQHFHQAFEEIKEKYNRSCKLTDLRFAVCVFILWTSCLVINK